MPSRRLRVLQTRAVYRVLKLWHRWARPITMGVRVIAVHEGKIVLVRHTYQPGWFLPGGGLKRKETLEAAARREAHEEAGLTLGPLSLFGVFSNFGEHKSDHVVVFLADVTAMSGDYDHEIAEVKLCAPDDLPPGMHPGSARRINDYASGERGLHGPW